MMVEITGLFEIQLFLKVFFFEGSFFRKAAKSGGLFLKCFFVIMYRFLVI